MLSESELLHFHNFLRVFGMHTCIQKHRLPINFKESIMKKISLLLIITISTLLAKVNIAVTYPYLAAITKQIGKSNVHITILGSSKYDPHFVVPKPSLLSRLNRADILIINGSGLEIGWLPPLLKRANNGKINPGRVGFVDVSQVIDMIDKPAAISRAFGDVHPEGNPHFNTDPHNIIPIAMLIAHKLEVVDPVHKVAYTKNLKNFLTKWQTFLKKFDKKMDSCKGLKVVQYHQLFNYFLKRYGIVSIGTIEPLPGIAPSSKHTIKLINTMKDEGVKVILQDTYHEKKTSNFISKKIGAKVVILPHDIYATKEANSLKNLYLSYAKKLCN